MAKDVLLAAIIGAQGLKGAVKAKIFPATPDALTRYGALHDPKGRRYEITAFRPGRPGEAVMSFQGIADRDAAEVLKGTELFIARDALPAADDGEFYHAQAGDHDRPALQVKARHTDRVGPELTGLNIYLGDMQGSPTVFSVGYNARFRDHPTRA